MIPVLIPYFQSTNSRVDAELVEPVLDPSLTEHLQWIAHHLCFCTKLDNFVCWEPARRPPAPVYACMDRCLAFRLWKPYRRWENNLWYLLSRRIILGLAHKCIWIHVVTKLIKFGESLKAHTDNITPFYAINEQGSSQSVRVTLEEGVLRTCLKTRVFQ